MATYTMLQYGSTGDEVKKLQTALGFTGKDVDGIFGSKTQQAVKNYQSKNGLSADGIAGDKTLGKLYGSSTASTSTTTTTPKDTSFKYEDFVYTDPKDSDTVKQAQAMLQEHMANKPGEFQYDYDSYLTDIYNKVMNKEKFSYDLNGDVLYQQYKDQHTTQGNQAMMDTMGQAQAATGGYGNSYAQTVGQQTYQGYLQQLNDKVPELYQLALNQYNQEYQDLYNQAALLMQDKEQKYGVHRDKNSDYYTELSRLIDAENTAYGREVDNRDFAYTQYSDKNSVQYQLQQDAYEHAMNMIGLGVMPSADKLASAGISSADAQSMVNKVLANEKKTVSSSSGSSSGGSSYDNGGYGSDIVRKAQEFVGTSIDGAWGSNSAAAAKAKGYNSLAEVVAAMGGNTGGGFTGKSYSEAVAYLKSKGVDGATASGIYTSREWSLRRNSKNNIAAQFKTYQEYLAYITEYHTT